MSSTLIENSQTSNNSADCLKLLMSLKQYIEAYKNLRVLLVMPLLISVIAISGVSCEGRESPRRQDEPLSSREKWARELESFSGLATIHTNDGGTMSGRIWQYGDHGLLIGLVGKVFTPEFSEFTTNAYWIKYSQIKYIHFEQLDTTKAAGSAQAVEDESARRDTGVEFFRR